MLDIGIFQGKAAVYNKLILEILVTQGDLSTWEIAKAICRIRNPDVKILPEVRYRRTQKIYSVIQRKGGRLEDLQEKEYIKYDCKGDSGKWAVGLKGTMTILALKPTLDSKIHPEARNFSELLSKPPTFPGKLKMFGAEVDGKVISTFMTTFMNEVKTELTNPKMFLNLAERTKQLAEEGINLDSISEQKFSWLMANEWSEMMAPRLKKKYAE
jgi:hypothetical protein